MPGIKPEDEPAIDEDKKRWFEARTMIYTKTPEQIRSWILRQLNDEYRDDMRRRLNVIKNRLPRKNKDESKSGKVRKMAGKKNVRR